MPKAKVFNPELRSFVLQHRIRQEALASDILKFIFRILKTKTKTLENSTSSLSFMSKINLLSDFDDINKEEYKHFEKFLAVRNQFAHNQKCISFEALGRENAEYTNFLTTNFPNEESDKEKKLLTSYIAPFKYCHKILCRLKFLQKWFDD